MRNLKKILALVLALVMSMSLVSVASAADFSDAEDVTYTEAVNYLTALKVFNGYKDGSFKPQGNITRAEVAAIIYRIDTVDITDAQAGIYAEKGIFTDVADDAWYAGYVNYCANAQYVKGVGDNKFNPNGNVTGYQVLAMILRVVGYDKNNEFTGEEWVIKVAQLAQKLGITENVTAQTLGAPATRELVAELLWRTIKDVQQVNYTLAFGYNTVDLKGKDTETIEQEKIGLYEDKGTDKWGFPYATIKAAKWPTAKGSTLFDNSPEAIHFTTEVMDHCCIASELEMKGFTQEMALYTNGVETKVVIDSVSTVKKLGEQGTEMYIYADRIILIDTYLAEVTDVKELITDKAGHVKQAPSATFTIYRANGNKSDFINNTTDYTKGEFMLYRYNDAHAFAEQIAAPEVLTGVQTTMWWNAEKHTINKVEYKDNINFIVDEAQFDNVNEHFWFIDHNGYAIGAKDVPPAPATPDEYAVVLGAQWINAVGAPGYALVTLQKLNGEIFSAPLLSIDKDIIPHYADTFLADFQTGAICTTYQYNDDTDEHLYVVTGDASGVKLTTVTKHYADVTIIKGFSVIANTDVACDNNTQYFYVGKDGSLVTMTGYASTDFEYKYVDAKSIDVVLNTTTGFAQYVYIYGESFRNDAPTVTPVTATTEFIFFTGGALSLYEITVDKVEYFMVYGAVNAKGEVTPLYFAKGDDAQATLDALLANMTVWENNLCVVTHTKNAVANMVADITPIAAVTELNGLKAERVEAEDFVYQNTGVLELVDGRKLNVTVTTTMIIENHVGNVAELVEAKDHDIYIIYTEDNFVKTVFIIPNIEA